MTGTAASLGEDLVDPLANQLRLGEEGYRVEVALDRAGVVERAPALIERNPPVEAENIRAGHAHGGKQASGIDSKIDDWDTELLDFADENFGRRENEIAVVSDAERSSPTVEDLDHVRSSSHLLSSVFAKHGHQFIEQQPPRSGLAIH